MLDEEAVETTEEAVTQEGVEKTVEAPNDGVDYEAELEKLRKERDNYKNGLLVAKGKKSLDDFAENEKEDIQELIVKTVEERLNMKNTKAFEEREADLVKKILSENKELKIALRNRAQTTAVSASSKTDTTEPAKRDQLTREQNEYLAKMERELPPGVKLDKEALIARFKARKGV